MMQNCKNVITIVIYFIINWWIEMIVISDAIKDITPINCLCPKFIIFSIIREPLFPFNWQHFDETSIVYNYYILDL